ncbi:hypothetical protein AMK24_29960 [Streptomyces sp. CB02366]|nr:hypothetical protein AMK24_29960 [Streptomyces sp. CB02366]
MAAPSPSAEFTTGNGDDLDARLTKQGVRVDISIIGNDNAWLKGNYIISAVPLLSLDRILVSSCLDDPKTRNPKRLGDDISKIAVTLIHYFQPDAIIAGVKRIGVQEF